MSEERLEQFIEKDKWSAKDYLKAFGPAAIIAASIVGPGTVTTASVVGANYRYAALWLIILAAILSYLFQEPATRITLGKGVPLLEGIRRYVGVPAAYLLYAAVFLGALAFQAGNFIGAALAIDFFLPGLPLHMWAVIMSAVALVMSWVGVYKIVENVNRVLIGAMVLAFILTAFVSGPSVGDMLAGGFSFRIPGGDYWLAIALVSTTMPANIVLALSAFLKRKYGMQEDKPKKLAVALARFDLRTNMAIAGLIAIAIVVTSATVLHPEGITVEGAGDMAYQLTPLLGRFAGVLFALGLLAAGFTSGLFQISMQPLLMNQALGKPEVYDATRSRVVMILASVVPVIIVWIFGAMPIQLIVGAQALNGIALPLVAGGVWYLCNSKEFLGDLVNNQRQNVTYAIVFIVALVLVLRTLLSITGVI